jgi:hypothetical protein
MPAPIQVGRRWGIERTHAWGNQYGRLRWCTERRRLVVQFWLALASAVIVCGRLLRRAWIRYRWQPDLAAAHDHLLAQALSYEIGAWFRPSTVLAARLVSGNVPRA